MPSYYLRDCKQAIAIYSEPINIEPINVIAPPAVRLKHNKNVHF